MKGRFLGLALTSELLFTLAGCGSGSSNSLTVGTVGHNDKTLSVSGSNFKVGAPIYFNVTDTKPFGTSKLTFLLEKKDGSGWTTVDNENMDVNPTYNIEQDSFSVDSSGTYKVTIFAGSSEIADTTLTVTK